MKRFEYKKSPGTPGEADEPGQKALANYIIGASKKKSSYFLTCLCLAFCLILADLLFSILILILIKWGDLCQ